ncbi:MAG: tRNA (adenosine(37)-N6)-threonylcarbamoyltransferase complex ATPase subunit type 1 TsaE [Pseudobdellovibrio sp.]
MNSHKELILKKDITNEDQFIEIVSSFKSSLNILNTAKVCFLLSGDLAAGKTTFVKIFCKSYGIENVSSPTFSLHHVYSNGDVQIDHFDLYRLNNESEIETSGVWETFEKPKSLVFIEWPERIDIKEIPMDYKIYEIKIQILTENNRSISIYDVLS